MRMIDADMLADGLKLHRQSTDQKHETDRQWAVGYNAGLERALYSISYAPTLTPPNEWVSVEERLPEEKQRVIVRCERVGTSVGWILWGNWMTDIGPDAGKVTHWMHLPKSPKEDE